MHSRILLVILIGVITLGATASTEGLFASLGLPELTLTVTDERLELSQAEVPAGRYLVTLDNQSEDPDPYVEIVRLMEEVTFDTSCPTWNPPRCLPWYFSTYVPGGVSGQSPQAVLNLPAGEYGLWGTWPESAEPDAILTVTGDPDAAIDGPEPEGAAIVVTKGDDGDGFSMRAEGALRPGLQLVKIVNVANQPLYVVAAQDPAPFIVARVAGTPVFGALGASIPFNAHDEEQFGQSSVTRPQSATATQWVAMDLTPGDVYLAAYITDPRDGDDTPYPWFAATAIVIPVAEA